VIGFSRAQPQAIRCSAFFLPWIENLIWTSVVVQRKLWPILDSLKIPRAGFHAFRHAASTLLIDLGATPATVQAQLGHSDPRITLSAYTHVVDKSQREAVEKLAGILMPKDAKTTIPANSGKWIQ
jgi:integrase